MKRMFCIIAVYAMVFISCNGRHQSSRPMRNEERKKIESDKHATTPTLSKPGTLISSKIKIKSNSLIKVISKTKLTKEEHKGDEMSARCKDWDISAFQISTIIRNGHGINMHDFSYLYYVLPCEIDGEINIDGAIYSYKLNAGSFFTISNSDTTYYYGCDDKKSKGVFLMTGGDPSRDLEK